MKAGDLIEVFWSDAYSANGWYEKGDIPDGVQPVKTAGYFLRRTRSTVQLAPSVALGTGTVGDPWVIPLKSIVKIVRR